VYPESYPRPFAPSFEGSLDRRFRPGLNGHSSLQSASPIFIQTGHCLPITADHRSKSFICNIYRRRASVANKRLIAKVSLLDATLARNRGWGRTFLPLRASVSLWPTCRPIAANRLWCHNPQRHQISSPSGETSPLPPVSKDTRAEFGNRSTTAPGHGPRFGGVASRA